MGRAEGSFPRVDLYWGVGRSLQSQVSGQRSQFLLRSHVLGAAAEISVRLRMHFDLHSA